MKSGKDFLYDKNDIVLALVILLVAGLLIFWRLNVIMDYPKTLAAETHTTDTTESAAPTQTDTKDKDTTDTDTTATTIWSNGTLSKDITVTVQGGSATSAVQSLVAAGLFTSYDDYSTVCKAAGYTPEDIKATTFTFKTGSTQTDIAKQVTN